MTNAISTQTVTALALPKDWQVKASEAGDGFSKFDFVLVQSEVQYRAVVGETGQPILITRDFSVTDRRGKLRLRLGKLIEPWRWRRTLLNEGISTVYLADKRGLAPVRIAARLAKVRVATRPSAR